MNQTPQQDNQGPVDIVIMAAGKGTRMKSALPKVLHRVAGRPQPILLVCSSRREDSCSAARAFADKAVAAGGRAEVLPVELNHGQLNAELGRPSGYTAGVQAFMQSLGLP